MTDILANVSRETSDRLQFFQDMVLKWTKRINLVASSTKSNFFHRHIMDSAQLFPLAPPAARVWVDLGSGGGFPGLVIAILAAEMSPELRVTMVESDQRKSAFLVTAAREMGLDVSVNTRRMETPPFVSADVVSARALAPAARLFALAHPYLHRDSVCLFLKGARVEDELTEAARGWHSRIDRIPSVTARDSVILRVTELRPADAR